MTAAQNRKRLNALRAEEAGAKKATNSQSERFFGPERRRQAQLNKQRIQATA